MFHHFYNEKHCRGQGAISIGQFEAVLTHYEKHILSAEEWFNRAVSNSLKDHDICLTFDDALLCQYEVALPVLERYGLTAFWFVYSSVLDGGLEKLEIYRKFRTVCYACIDDFYLDFFSRVKASAYNDAVELALKGYAHDNWKYCPFYSPNDTKFRYIRDVALGVDKYQELMDRMICEQGIDLASFASDLWMTKEHVRSLCARGHVIGLHSHTHPTVLADLPATEQQKEYGQNYRFLRDLLGKSPEVVSHPCNSYNVETLKILAALGIRLGFRANMADHQYSRFEFAREDHANVIRRIGQ
ncbi:MAG: polysaccharide deacetylase family protein [Candidatus Omnitrophica bacterium]|nr:polysaccharide deacetylase family protein [Candidatus Omnitrophota bacterium]